MLQMTQMSCVGVRRSVTLIFNFLIPLGEIKRKLGGMLYMYSTLKMQVGFEL